MSSVSEMLECVDFRVYLMLVNCRRALKYLSIVLSTVVSILDGIYRIPVLVLRHLMKVSTARDYNAMMYARCTLQP